MDFELLAKRIKFLAKAIAVFFVLMCVMLFFAPRHESEGIVSVGPDRLEAIINVLTNFTELCGFFFGSCLLVRASEPITKGKRARAIGISLIPIIASWFLPSVVDFLFKAGRASNLLPYL